ncbi:MAG: hypothetical protein F6K19_34185, partial [Cyanothece sp. SIO1E1]|nr:hypothetical protein [Cyanothece sp. SIO1E1]
MQCWGRTKGGKRCRNHSKFLFCHVHKRQFWIALWGFIGIIATLGGVFQDVLKPIFQREDKATLESHSEPHTLMVTTKEGGDFTPIFRPYDTTHFNVLIIRFEDYIAGESTECIGRSIQDHLSTIQAEEKLPLFLSTHYVADSIPPPTSVEEANNIQKRHHADLIIYGLARNVQ